MKDYERVWREFWKPLVTRRGKLDLDAVKRELFDFHTVMDEVQKVYCNLTRSQISKPNTLAEEVIRVVEDLHGQDITEAVEEARDCEVAGEDVLKFQVSWKSLVKSQFYRNCRLQRRHNRKCCASCPFKSAIEKTEANN